MNGKKTHTHTHAYFLRITLDLTVQSGPVLSQVSTVVLCYQIVALVRRVSVDPVWPSRSPDPPIYCVADDLRLYGITGDWSPTALDPGVWYSTVRDGGCRFMAAWVKEEEEKASEHRQRKREAKKADTAEVAPGVTVASLRRFIAALIGPTKGLPKRRRLYLERNLKL